MNWLLFIAATLGCFRLSRLISEDKIFSGLRREVVKDSPRRARKKVKEGITCPFCVSFYVAGFFALCLWMLYVYGWEWLGFWWAAIWGGSILWNQVFVALTNEN